MLFRNVGAKERGVIQKACSALLRGFESRNRDWEPKNRIFVYNAFALYNCPSVVDEQQLKDLHINCYDVEKD